MFLLEWLIIVVCSLLDVFKALSRANHPSRVKILLSSSEGKLSGLLADSVVMTDNLATIAESEIDRVIGYLPTTKIDIALKHTLGLSLSELHQNSRR